MSFNLTIPKLGGTPININVGKPLFILGANGAGKSSLLHRFYSQNRASARRITAHRQTWFNTNSMQFLPEQKRHTERQIQNNDAESTSRWREDYADQRANIAIYELIDAEIVRARKITRAVDENKLDHAKNLSEYDSPIKVINELLQLSNISIKITVTDEQSILASKAGSAPYSITELSDGERNAVLLSAIVLTMKSDTLVLLDEPERHLHRSIISPLLTNLFAKRPDCSFVISTHDLMLPIENPDSSTLLIRGCNYNNSSVTAWDADLVPQGSTLADELKKDVLGARSKILFIEGTEQSLDKPLYSLLFPNASIIAKSSCRDVEHAVSGIRDAAEFHWLHAFGIVDNDRRTQGEIDKLKVRGVYAVSVFSVESLYYHPEIQRRVAERQAAVTGEDAPTRLMNAQNAAIASIRPHIQRLSERGVEKSLRGKILQFLPGRKEIAAAVPINISVDIAGDISGERSRLQAALDAGNLSAIVAQYPVRETPALLEIATKLGFQNCEQYQGAVRKLLMDDKEALAFLRSLFGTLEADINA